MSNSPPSPFDISSKRPKRALVYAELAIMDSAAIVGAQVMAAHLIDQVSLRSGVEAGLTILPLYLGFAAGHNVFTSQAFGRMRESAWAGLQSLFLAYAAFSFLAYIGNLTVQLDQFALIIGAFFSAILLFISRIVTREMTRAHLGESALNELMILDGVELAASKGTCVIEAKGWNIQPDLNSPEMPQRFARLVAAFDRVIVGCAPEQRNAWTLLLRASNVKGEIVVPEVDAVGILGVGAFDNHYTHIVAPGPMPLVNRARKRALDLIIAVPAIIALTPLMALVAMAIKLDSQGPIFFRQERVGRSNQIFRIFKFRSMRVELADADGHRSVCRDDNRVTRLGRMIRASSVDELPQLFNVVLGEMSLVGPRPHALGSRAGNQLFWEIDNQYWVRHALKPGITGLAQVRGFRGATMVGSDLTNRLEADLEYIENWTLIGELEILARTLLVIVHRNAY